MWTIYAILSKEYALPCILVVDDMGELRCHGRCLACLVDWLSSIGQARATVYFAEGEKLNAVKDVDLSQFSSDHLTPACARATRAGHLVTAGNGEVHQSDPPPAPNRQARRQDLAAVRRAVKRRRP